jgi:hypothetical protein
MAPDTPSTHSVRLLSGKLLVRVQSAFRGPTLNRTGLHLVLLVHRRVLGTGRGPKAAGLGLLCATCRAGRPSATHRHRVARYLAARVGGRAQACAMPQPWPCSRRTCRPGPARVGGPFDHSPPSPAAPGTGAQLRPRSAGTSRDVAYISSTWEDSLWRAQLVRVGPLRGRRRLGRGPWRWSPIESDAIAEGPLRVDWPCLERELARYRGRQLECRVRGCPARYRAWAT